MFLILSDFNCFLNCAVILESPQEFSTLRVPFSGLFALPSDCPPFGNTCIIVDPRRYPLYSFGDSPLITSIGTFCKPTE